MKQKIFILLFILSLASPTPVFLLVRDYLDTENYENRTLASFPELSWANFDNLPGEFETFFNDHAPFKNYFVNLNTKLETKLFGFSSVAPITIGTDNWLFYTVDVKGEDALSDYQHTNLYTTAQQEEITEKIRSTARGMEEQGIRFFVFEAPNKERIYRKYMPQNIRVYGTESRLDVCVSLLQKEGLPVYDLTDALQKYAEDYQIYYKYDTHWNLVGAYIASQQIAEVLFGSSIPLEEMSVLPDSTISGDMATMLNLSNELSDDTEYVVEGYLPEITAEGAASDLLASFEVFHSNSSNDRTLLVIGDSFSQALKRYLPKLYQTAVFCTFTSYTPEVFSQYDIDDVVFINVERNQRYFENIPQVLDGSFEEDTEEEP